MAWTTGRRLPTTWPAIRRRILARDGHQCTWTQADGSRCPETTRLEVDHIDDPHNHDPANLRTLCHWHHARVTAAQFHHAKQTNRKPPAAKHPGLT